MEIISVKQQIEVVTKAKKLILRGEHDYVCVAIWSVLKASGFGILYPRYNSSNAVKFIPLLTIENAALVCKKYKLKMPVLGPTQAWWDCDYGYSNNKKSRMAFMNWMIKELNKKL